MGTYPIKVLIDEHNDEFVPWVSADCIHTADGLNFEEKFATKIDASNLKEGTGITITKEGADCTFNVDFGASDNIIDNLDTTTAGLGPLDARQGNVLKNMIPQIVDNLETTDATKVLSANQGYQLSKRAVPDGGNAGQVLKRAEDGTSLEWGDAADPNAIIGDGSIMKIIELTYEEYKTLESNGELQDDTEYHIIDMSSISGVGMPASQVEMSDGTNIEEVLANLSLDIGILQDEVNVHVGSDAPKHGEKIWIKKAVNLYDQGALNPGYIALDGVIAGQTADEEMFTHYIPVKPNTVYTFKIVETRGTKSPWMSIAEYTADKVFIQRPTAWGAVPQSITITTTANTHYVILNGRNLNTAVDAFFTEGGSLLDLVYINDNGNYILISDIIEQGENGNGSWVKYRDGRMECFRVVDMGKCQFALHSGGLYTDQTNGGYFNWVLPQTFKDRNVSFTALAMSSAYMCTSSGGLSDDLTNLNIYYHTNYSCTVNVALCLTATGYWR